MLAEDELEENSDSEERASPTLGRKISHDRMSMSGGTQGNSRKMSAIESMLPSRKTSASSSTCPSRKWSRHSSPTRGEVLRMDDEVREDREERDLRLLFRCTLSTGAGRR